MTRLYVAAGRIHKDFADAIDSAARPGDVMVVERVGFIDDIAEEGVLQEEIDD